MNIIDDFIKLDMDAPQIAGRTEKDLAFNRKVKSCYDMYQWLYKNDILRKEAFLYTENSSTEELEVSFAIDTENLLPYRKKMETSGVKDADLACRYIFGDKGYETSPIMCFCLGIKGIFHPLLHPLVSAIVTWMFRRRQGKCYKIVTSF